MSLGELRALAVAVGDGLVVLEMNHLSDYPTPAGLSFEQKAAQVSARLAELLRRTRVEWKRALLQLVARELSQGIEKGRQGDEEGSHRLLVDAQFHFREYERGEPPRTTFLAGPDGVLAKADD